MKKCYITKGEINDNVELGEYSREKYNNCYKKKLEPITTIEIYIQDGVRYEIEKTLRGIILSIKSRLL